MMQQMLVGLGGGPPVFVDDVFKTYLYTGNNSTNAINNGIDFAGEGGMLWVKSRNNTSNENLSLIHI